MRKKPLGMACAKCKLASDMECAMCARFAADHVKKVMEYRNLMEKIIDNFNHGAKNMAILYWLKYPHLGIEKMACENERRN